MRIASFLDFDQLAYRDNKYVLAKVIDAPAAPALKNRYGLFPVEYVEFECS